MMDRNWKEATDGELLAAFRRDRRDEAFGELVRRHLPLVHGVALRRLGSAALAEEAAQLVFLRLVEKSAEVSRHAERLRGWLHRSAWLEANNLARKEARQGRLRGASPAAAGTGERPEMFDRLDEALARLPELDRELVLRKCCAGEEYARLAQGSGSTVAACQKRVERALARLAKSLGAGEVTPVAVGAALAGIGAGQMAGPAVERVTTAVMDRAADGAGAALSFFASPLAKVAACVILGGAGGLAGWPEPERTAAEANVPDAVRERRAESNRARVAAGAESGVLVPRVVSAPRPLDELLESIQAGRLGPLVEFLPQASAADLRAIIAEDDIGMYGETDAQDDYGAARNLALDRWVEVDPQGAFQFAVLDGGGGDLQAVVTHWLRSDPAAVAAAVRGLPLRERIELFSHLPPAPAAEVSAVMPELAWTAGADHYHSRFPPLTFDEAERVVAGLLAPGGGDGGGRTLEAFRVLAKRDPDDALTRAAMIGDPESRAVVLNELYRDHPPVAATLPVGKTRANLLAEEIGELARRDPEAAMKRMLAARPGGEQRVVFTKLLEVLGHREPLRLMEIAAALTEPVGWVDMEAVLKEAGRRDPHGALARVPGLAAKVDAFSGVAGMVEPILEGWAGVDPEAAVRMSVELGVSSGDADKIPVADPEPLIRLLADPNPSVTRRARSMLHGHFQTAWIEGTAPALLARMPGPQADLLVEERALEAVSRSGIVGALRIAALASPEAIREKIQPAIAVATYQLAQSPDDPHDPTGTVDWVRSLPEEEQRAVIARLEEIAGKTRSADWANQMRRLVKEVRQ